MGFAQTISHVLVFFVVYERLVLAVLRLNKHVFVLRHRCGRSCALQTKSVMVRCSFSGLVTSCMELFFTALLMISRSLITWPRKDTAVLKPCCAWNQLTKKSMVVLCLLLARMHVPNIEWGSVSITIKHIISDILMRHTSRYTEGLGRRQSRSVQGRLLCHH